MGNNVIRRVWNKNSLTNIEDLCGMIFQAEAAGHTFEIRGVDGDGNAIALSGTPSGVMLRPDGTDVALDCAVTDGAVTATLPAECYDVQGRFGLTVYLTSDGQTTAIYAAVGSVARTSSGNVSPGTTASVVDLINAIEAAIEQIPASDTNLKAALATTYSTSAVYPVGSYAWYNGKLYKCIVAITSGETWTSAHWTEAKLGQDVCDLKSATENNRNESGAYRERLADQIFEQTDEYSPNLSAGGFSATTGVNNGSSMNAIRCKTGYMSYSTPLMISLSGLDEYLWNIWAYVSSSNPTHSCMARQAFLNASIDCFTNFVEGDAYFRLCFQRVDGANLTTDKTDPTSDYSKILAALKFYKPTKVAETVDAAIEPVRTAMQTAVDQNRTEASVYLSRVAENEYTKRVDNITLLASGINSSAGTTNSSEYDSIRCRTQFKPVSSGVHISLGREEYLWTVFAYSNNTSGSGTHTCMVRPAYINASIDVITNFEAGDKYIRIAFARVDGAELTTDLTDPTSDYSIILDNLKIYAVEETEDGANIEEYYETEMKNTVDSVIACQSEPCLVFPLVTDIHWATDSLTEVGGDSYLFTKETIYNLRRFAGEVKCDGLICLGDITDGGYNSAIPATAAQGIEVGSMLMNKMRSVGVPLYFTVGNHDDCRYIDPGWMLTPDIYATYLSKNDKDVVFDMGYYGMNWYKDFSQFGVRMIQIDTNRIPTIEQKGRYGVASQTVNFLTNALSGMNENWLAIVITHAPVIDGLMVEGASSIYNIDAVVNAINNSGKTAVVLAGHTHYDVSTVSPFIHVVTAANKNSIRDEGKDIETKGGEIAKVYVRELESGTKDLWDVVVLRPFSKLLNLVRFGSGVDRCFHIEPISLTGQTTLTTSLTGTVTWSSSDVSVATVSSGTVTSVGAGKCGIVATDETGNMETWVINV